MNRRELFMGAGAALALSGTAAAAALADPDALVFRKAIEVDALKRLHDRAFEAHGDAQLQWFRDRSDAVASAKNDATETAVYEAIQALGDAVDELAALPVATLAGLRCKAENALAFNYFEGIAEAVLRDVLTLGRASS